MQADRMRLLNQASNYLSDHDPIMATLVHRFGPCTIAPHTNYYLELASSIISQQLSIKAADTIWKRFLHLFNDIFPMPQEILAKPIEELRAIGLSRAKAAYIQDLATHILDGRLAINTLTTLSNQEIINELTAIKGIGEWTAQMFLMFSLGRLDILATGDLGIRNGIKRLYNLENMPNASVIRALADNHCWHPYETVACWYVWRSLDTVPVIVEQS